MKKHFKCASLLALFVMVAIPQVRAEKVAFPQSCTRAAAPLKPCLFNEAIDHMWDRSTQYETFGNGKKRAITPEQQSSWLRINFYRLLETATLKNYPQEKSRLIHEAMGFAKVKNIRTWDDVLFFSALVPGIAAFGTAGDIAAFRNCNDEIPDSALPAEVKPIKGYRPPSAKNKADSTRHQLTIQKAMNNAELLLATGDAAASLRQLKALSEKFFFESSPYFSVEDMTTAAIRQGNLDAAFEFLKDVTKINFDARSETSRDMAHAPSPEVQLMFAYLNKENFVKAKEVKSVCAACPEYIKAYIKYPPKPSPYTLSQRTREDEKKLLLMLQDGHERQAITELKAVHRPLPWLMEQPISDDVQKHAFEELWPLYSDTKDGSAYSPSDVGYVIELGRMVYPAILRTSGGSFYEWYSKAIDDLDPSKLNP